MRYLIHHVFALTLLSRSFKYVNYTAILHFQLYLFHPLNRQVRKKWPVSFFYLFLVSGYFNFILIFSSERTNHVEDHNFRGVREIQAKNAGRDKRKKIEKS
jgi:hypothetical protein